MRAGTSTRENPETSDGQLEASMTFGPSKAGCTSIGWKRAVRLHAIVAAGKNERSGDMLIPVA